MELQNQNSLTESIWIQACNHLVDFHKKLQCVVLMVSFECCELTIWCQYCYVNLCLKYVSYAIILIQANWFCQTFQCYLQMWCELCCQTLYHHLTRGLPFATFIMLKVLCLDNGWSWKMVTLIESPYKVLLNWLVSFNLL